MKPIIHLIAIASCLALLAPFAMAEAPKLPTEVKVKDITFLVSLVSTAEGESLKIAITGQATKVEPTLVPIKGKIAYLEAADLLDDGLPEIYLAIAPEDTKKMSQLIVFVADMQKGLIPVSFAPARPDAKLEFRGGDSFSIKDGHVLHHLPLYRQKDADGSPTAWQEDTSGLSATESGAWSLIATSSRAGMGRARKKPR